MLYTYNGIPLRIFLKATCYNMEESHKNINKRKSQIHAVHTVWLYLNEIQKQTKLIYGNKSQNGGWQDGRMQYWSTRSTRRAGDVLYPDLGVGTQVYTQAKTVPLCAVTLLTKNFKIKFLTQKKNPTYPSSSNAIFSIRFCQLE